MVPECLKYNVFETLRGKRLDLQQWASPTEAGTGKRGQGTVGSTTQVATDPLHLTQPTCSSPLLLPCGKASTASDVKSRFSQCPKLSEPSPKGTFLCGGCREDGAQKLEFSFFSTFDVRLRRGQDGIHVGNNNETSTITTILHYGSSPSIASWRV